MQKVIHLNPNKYTGCLQCEMASKLHLARQLVGRDRAAPVAQNSPPVEEHIAFVEQPSEGIATLLWATEPEAPHRLATPFFHAAAAAAMDVPVEMYFTARSVHLLVLGVAWCLSVSQPPVGRRAGSWPICSNRRPCSPARTQKMLGATATVRSMHHCWSH